ncbi:MAG: CBS domain-containing protein [Acidobacteriota bacterium]|nr:CBS domain-containing protein [Acidobacteriota bacterium]
MSERTASSKLTGEQLRRFMRDLLNDLRALETMLEEGRIESGVRRIGAEQEMFLIDSSWRPAPKALEVLEKIDDGRFTTELGLFNLEVNLDPLKFGGDCLSRMERQLDELLEKGRQAARAVGADILLVGILPTLRKSDLEIENMTPMPRYHALNDAMNALRGGAYDFHIRGIDELIVRHDSVMLEACNASFQVHFQVGGSEFARLYNIAQAVAGPVLAVSTFSPLLFGRRLWRETRIALFQQSVDTRSSQDHLRERSPRVSFGRSWVDRSVVELYKEDIARFRALIATEPEEDPFLRLARGEAPELKALRLHNGTVYRWNRPCYGVMDGVPHLRIENRVFPAGPTNRDEIANAALWYGLIAELANEHEDIGQVMMFEHALENFETAARHGLGAEFTWLGGEQIRAQKLILERLIPCARRGLQRSGIDAEDIDRYLGVIEGRVSSRMTGSRWVLASLDAMKDGGTAGERANALTAAIFNRQQEAVPAHEWPCARLEEAGGWKNNYLKVEQYMTTDLYTVHGDEPIDLVANLMQWQKIRHVPVEDNQHRLIGLVSYRHLLRLLASGALADRESGIPVSEIMTKDPVTAYPEMSTLEATQLMKEKKVACLPVVKDGRLVGIVTERDFMVIARELLEQRLRE